MRQISLKKITTPEIFRGYIPALDGLRGISILFVVFTHVAHSNNSPGWLMKGGDYLITGNLGVEIFFFISGFLITGLLLKEKAELGSINLKAFYWRRFLRIFPVFYFFLLAVFIATHTSVAVPIDGKKFIAPLLYFSNFAYGDYNPGWFLGHTWSLSIEEQFYIIWPFLLLLFRNFRTIYFVLFLLLHVLLRVMGDSNPEVWRFLLGPFMGYAALLLGGAVLAFFSYTQKDHLIKTIKKIKLPLIFIVFCIALIVELFIVQGRFGLVLLPFGRLLTSAILFIIIGHIIFVPDKLNRALRNKPLVFIGKVSYSWYLWQEIFLTQNGDHFFNGRLSVLNEFPYNIMASFAVAVLMYFTLEKYFLRFKTPLRPLKGELIEA